MGEEGKWANEGVGYIRDIFEGIEGLLFEVG